MDKAKKSQEKVVLSENQKEVDKQISNQARRTRGHNIKKSSKEYKAFKAATKKIKRPKRVTPNSKMTVEELGKAFGLTTEQLIDMAKSMGEKNA